MGDQAVRDADRVLTRAEQEEARLLADLLDGLHKVLTTSKHPPARGLAKEVAETLRSAEDPPPPRFEPAFPEEVHDRADAEAPSTPKSVWWDAPSVTLRLDDVAGHGQQEEPMSPTQAKALRRHPSDAVEKPLAERPLPERPSSRNSSGPSRRALVAEVTERLAGTSPSALAPDAEPLPERPSSRNSSGPSRRAIVAEVTERLAGTPPSALAPDAEADPAAADQPVAPKKPFTYLKRKDLGPAGAGVAQKKPIGLLPFLRGTGTDYYGRTLEEILEWDFSRMEKVHNYIQWLFPTDEPSKFNKAAPQFTPEVQAKVRDDPALQGALLRAMNKFCAFLGLEFVQKDGEDDGPLLVRKAAHYEERVPTCWDTRFGGNHNWLRVSRMLHCLRLAGLDREAAALHACLEELYAEGVPCGVAIPHWRKRVATVATPALRPAPRRPAAASSEARADCSGPPQAAHEVQAAS